MGLVMPPIKVQYSSKLMRPSWLASKFWMSLSAALRFPVSWEETGSAMLRVAVSQSPRQGPRQRPRIWPQQLLPLADRNRALTGSGLGAPRGQRPESSQDPG